LQVQVANGSFGGLLAFDDFIRVISHYQSQQMRLEETQHTVDRLVLSSASNDTMQPDAEVDADRSPSCFGLEAVPEEVAVAIA
jgi:hypothetical protein